MPSSRPATFRYRRQEGFPSLAGDPATGALRCRTFRNLGRTSQAIYACVLSDQQEEGWTYRRIRVETANRSDVVRSRKGTFRYGQTRLSLSLSLSLSLTRFRRKPPAVKAMINGAE
jgi:hypothetical protein